MRKGLLDTDLPIYHRVTVIQNRWELVLAPTHSVRDREA
jgi:hypothetical protein